MAQCKFKKKMARGYLKVGRGRYHRGNRISMYPRRARLTYGMNYPTGILRRRLGRLPILNLGQRYRARVFSRAAHKGRVKSVNESIKRLGRRRAMSKVLMRKGFPRHMRSYMNKFI